MKENGYSYNQLCFTFDNLRGMTTQLAFKDSNLIGIGVDGILEHYYPEIKKLLLSESMSDYKKGLMYLFSGFNDGGHTMLNGKEFLDEKFLTNLIEDENNLLFLNSCPNLQKVILTGNKIKNSGKNLLDKKIQLVI